VKTKTVAGQVTTYTYDALGNLVTVQLPNAAPLITYLVDGQGRRIGKKVGSTIVKRWLYRNGLNPVAELDGAGNLLARFVYGSRPNVPDLVIKGTQTYRLLIDHLGSPRAAVNIRSDILEIPYRADYSAFGEATPAGGLSAASLDWIPFGFAGGIYDRDTGLIRFGARDYDPSIGRWVSKDPIRFAGAQANLYLYVGNDPINRRDPSGLTDREWGNFARCSADILACSLVCRVATIACYACLGKVFMDVDSSACWKPFGLPDELPPRAPPDCPPGYHPGEYGWGNAVCEPDECSGSECACAAEPEPNQSIGAPFNSW
jgi:RHS repeat-associated protein